MGIDETGKQTKHLYQLLVIIGIIIISFNLRPAITSIGPLVGMIRDDLSLSNWSVGFLTSLPLIAFAILSPIVPRLGSKYTNERVMILGLLLLVIGIFIRSITSVSLLFVGTILIGFGIAIMNVLLPGVVKDKFPTKVGLMTSIYSTTMGAVAATASGLSVPLAKGLYLGWQKALLVWTIPAIIGIILWLYLYKENTTHKQSEKKPRNAPSHYIWKSLLAWQVALFMGLQSILFYVTIAWLPAILTDYGVSLATAGWLLSITQFVGLPASLLVPILAERYSSQRGLVTFMVVCALAGFGGLLLGGSYIVIIFSIILIGITLSGSFALALAFLGLRTRTATEAAELSGMAQSIGYILAAVGPILIGYLYDLTHGWTVPLIAILIVSVLIFIFGIGASRNKYVLD